MSVRVMGLVWENSTAEPTDRLVLLAIADCANDQGAEAYPSMVLLTRKTGLHERSIQRALHRLVALGELSVQPRGGPRGCNRYRVTLTPGTTPPPALRHPGTESPRQDDAPGTLPPIPRHSAGSDPGTAPPEPSLNHQRTVSRTFSSVKPTRPDVEQICRHLADRLAANGVHRNKITAKWRTEARLLLDADGRTVEQVIKAIDWCTTDPFWRSNVLSMPTLREKYDQLRLAAQRPNGRASPLVEVNGLSLRPETAAHMQDRAKWEAQDRLAIEGPT